MAEELVMICDVDLNEADATRVHTLEVARGFAGEGFLVDLLTRGPDPSLPGVRHTRAHGTDHQRIRRALSLVGASLWLLWRRRSSATRLYVRHRWSLLPALAAGRALGYRIVVQLDDLGYEPPVSPGRERLHIAVGRLMARLVHGVVAVTPQIKERSVARFKLQPDQVRVLPNGADIETFVPLEREAAIKRLGLDPGHHHVLFCGHFAPWVDFPTILDGFATVARERPDARLVLLGDGAERSAIEARLGELGLGPAVIITGYVSDRACVRDYMAAAVVTVSANVLQRRAEIGVSPVKVAEYMACGRAVVATELPGLREALEQPGAGRVVAADPAAFGQAILELLNPALADELGARGRRLAEERHSWPMIVRRTLPLFGL